MATSKQWSKVTLIKYLLLITVVVTNIKLLICKGERIQIR